MSCAAASEATSARAFHRSMLGAENPHQLLLLLLLVLWLNCLETFNSCACREPERARSLDREPEIPTELGHDAGESRIPGCQPTR